MMDARFIIKAEYDEDTDTIQLDFSAAPTEPEFRRLLAQAFSAANKVLVEAHYS